QSRGGTRLPDGPRTTAAAMARPLGAPPPSVSMSVRSVQPASSSTTPGRRSCPESPNTLVPYPPPSPANHAPPCSTIDGTAHRVSTLLITVGLPQRPASAGNGGRVGGIARRPS